MLHHVLLLLVRLIKNLLLLILIVVRTNVQVVVGVAGVLYSIVVVVVGRSSVSFTYSCGGLVERTCLTCMVVCLSIER